MTDSSTPGTLDQDRATPEAYLVILRGSQAGEKIPLQPGVNLLGREEGYILRDGRVSRRHAQIQFIGDEFILVDLHSTNGTFVNGSQVHQATMLQHGDSIRLGDTILTFRQGDESQGDPSIVGARTPETKLDRGDSTLLVGRLIPWHTDPDISGRNTNEDENSSPSSKQ